MNTYRPGTFAWVFLLTIAVRWSGWNFSKLEADIRL